MDIKQSPDGARGMAVNQAAVSSNNTYFCLITVKMLPKDLTEDTMLFKINTSANIALILTLLRKNRLGKKYNVVARR